MTDDNVTVDRQQRRQPGGDEPDEVDDREKIDEDVLVDDAVAPEQLGGVVEDGQRAQQEGADEDEGVSHRDRLQQHRGGETLLLTTQHRERDHVGDDPDEDDRSRDDHFADEAQHEQLRARRSGPRRLVLRRLALAGAGKPRVVHRHRLLSLRDQTRSPVVSRSGATGVLLTGGYSADTSWVRSYTNIVHCRR